MAHNLSDRALERRIAWVNQLNAQWDASRHNAALAEAQAAIQAWNARVASEHPTLLSPTIRAALSTGFRWLAAYCPGCRAEREIDLAAIDRHPDTAITSLIPSLSCMACRPNAPFAKLHGLRRRPPTPMPDQPYQIEERGACFIIRDGRGNALAYVYFADRPTWDGTAPRMSRAEAQRVADNIARLPVLLARQRA